jgi:hypothetical protein
MSDRDDFATPGVADIIPAPIPADREYSVFCETLAKVAAAHSLYPENQIFASEVPWFREQGK